jgi:hypothetical protein
VALHLGKYRYKYNGWGEVIHPSAIPDGDGSIDLWLEMYTQQTVSAILLTHLKIKHLFSIIRNWDDESL